MGVKRAAGGGGSGSSSSDPWVFTVQDPGEGEDATANILEALTDAVAYGVAQENRYVELALPVRPYPWLLESALTQGGATLGNAQIPLPIIEPEDRKLTLIIRGCLDASAMPYWLQEVPPRWGVTLRSTLTGQTNSSTWGAPSMLGGPAVSGSSAEFGPSHGSLFNNVLVDLRGIGFSNPLNPTIGGIDLRAIAEAKVQDCSVMPNGDKQDIDDSNPSNDWGFGLLLPTTTNNDLSIVRNVSVYGQYVGFSIGEHAWVDRTASIYCHDGVVFPAELAGTHSSALGAISIEGCVDAIRCYQSERAPVDMRAVSVETITGYDINDPNNALRGNIQLNKISGTIAVNGASNVRIESQNQSRGAQTPPSVPATGVGLRNPFWRDCEVKITGGTVTAVEIDGEDRGATSGYFLVPTGSTIEITHSSAPTWTWRVL